MAKIIQLTGYSGSATNVNLPTSIDKVKVKIIGESVFAEKSIATVRGDEIINIVDANEDDQLGVFDSCDKLTTASFPNCAYVGKYAFYSCYSLTTVSFPSCSKIEEAAFYECSSLNAASFPNCKYIGEYAFSRCYSLATISFPNCSYIGAGAFIECSALTTVSFPNCSYVGTSAFPYCASLNTAYFLSTAYTQGSYGMFDYCSSLTSIYVPASMVDTYKTMSGWSECASLITAYTE